MDIDQYALQKSLFGGTDTEIHNKAYREELHARERDTIPNPNVNPGQYAPKGGRNPLLKVVQHETGWTASTMLPGGKEFKVDGPDRKSAISQAIRAGERMGHIFDPPAPEPEIGGMFSQAGFIEKDHPRETINAGMKHGGQFAEKPFVLQRPKKNRKVSMFDNNPNTHQDSLFDAGKKNELPGQNLLFNTDPADAHNPHTQENRTAAKEHTPKSIAHEAHETNGNILNIMKSHGLTAGGISKAKPFHDEAAVHLENIRKSERPSASPGRQRAMAAQKWNEVVNPADNYSRVYEQLELETERYLRENTLCEGGIDRYGFGKHIMRMLLSGLAMHAMHHMMKGGGATGATSPESPSVGGAFEENEHPREAMNAGQRQAGQFAAKPAWAMDDDDEPSGPNQPPAAPPVSKPAPKPAGPSAPAAEQLDPHTAKVAEIWHGSKQGYQPPDDGEKKWWHNDSLIAESQQHLANHDPPQQSEYDHMPPKRNINPTKADLTKINNDPYYDDPPQPPEMQHSPEYDRIKQRDDAQSSNVWEGEAPQPPRKPPTSPFGPNGVGMRGNNHGAQPAPPVAKQWLAAAGSPIPEKTAYDTDPRRGTPEQKAARIADRQARDQQQEAPPAPRNYPDHNAALTSGNIDLNKPRPGGPLQERTVEPAPEPAPATQSQPSANQPEPFVPEYKKRHEERWAEITKKNAAKQQAESPEAVALAQQQTEARAQRNAEHTANTAKAAKAKRSASAKAGVEKRQAIERGKFDPTGWGEPQDDKLQPNHHVDEAVAEHGLHSDTFHQYVNEMEKHDQDNWKEQRSLQANIRKAIGSNTRKRQAHNEGQQGHEEHHDIEESLSGEIPSSTLVANFGHDTQDWDHSAFAMANADTESRPGRHDPEWISKHVKNFKAMQDSHQPEPEYYDPGPNEDGTPFSQKSLSREVDRYFRQAQQEFRRRRHSDSQRIWTDIDNWV